MKTLLRHLTYWGENYIAGPVVIGILILATILINRATGTDSAEDIGAIVGWLINGVGIVIVVTLTGLTQHFLFGYRSRGETQANLADDIYDTCVSCFLLSLYSVIIFGWLK